MAIGEPLIRVIEDNAASADALGMILRDWGAETAHADGADTIETAVGPRFGDDIEAGACRGDCRLAGTRLTERAA